MMTKRFIAPQSNGGISVIEVAGADPDGHKLTKILFELSRTSDLATHFDPVVHTRKAIAAGISGHRALALAAECEDSDLPTDRYFRDAWEWSD